jgi:hypothetical protein
MRYTGSCLCGGVQYVLGAELGAIEVCYCQMCRKASGESRVFCAKCGSPIYSRQLAKPELVRIRVGTISEPLNVRPAANYYVGSKCNWWDIHDALPSFDTE